MKFMSFYVLTTYGVDDLPSPSLIVAIESKETAGRKAPVLETTLSYRGPGEFTYPTTV